MDVEYSGSVVQGALDRWRVGTGESPRPVPTPPGVPSATDMLLAQLSHHMEEQSTLFRTLSHLVATEDLIVYEHDTQQLPTTAEVFTLNLVAQTAQQELIKGVFAAITVPTLVAAPTIDVTNAWADLGGNRINLNAILNSAGGTGGMLPGEYAFILNSESKRQLNIVASADWPAGAMVTFILFGTVMSSSIPGILH